MSVPRAVFPPLGELASRIAAAGPGVAVADEEELCRALGPRIRLYGLRHLRDREAAQDLAQQALLTTLQLLRGGRVREPGSIESFVFATCRNMVRDLKRGLRRHRAAEERAATPVEVPAPEPLDLGRLEECLKRLAHRERAVVVLSFYAERSSAEIGDELSVSAPNVRVIRHRALARLRDCLEGR